MKYNPNKCMNAGQVPETLGLRLININKIRVVYDWCRESKMVANRVVTSWSFSEKDKDKDYIIMSNVRTQRTTIEIKWDIVGEKMIKDVLLNVTIT